MSNAHVHAELMAQYAEDAQNSEKPWRLWALNPSNGKWMQLTHHPNSHTNREYRRHQLVPHVAGVPFPDMILDKYSVNNMDQVYCVNRVFNKVMVPTFAKNLSQDMFRQGRVHKTKESADKFLRLI